MLRFILVVATVLVVSFVAAVVFVFVLGMSVFDINHAGGSFYIHGSVDHYASWGDINRGMDNMDGFIHRYGYRKRNSKTYIDRNLCLRWQRSEQGEQKDCGSLKCFHRFII